MDEDDQENRRFTIRFITWTIVGFITVVVFATWLSWWTAGKQADHFNKVCNTNITQADAFWLQLRVDNCVVEG